MVNSKLDELEGKTAMALEEQIKTNKLRFLAERKGKVKKPKRRRKKTEEDGETERKRLRYKGQINRA